MLWTTEHVKYEHICKATLVSLNSYMWYSLALSMSGTLSTCMLVQMVCFIQHPISVTWLTNRSNHTCTIKVWCQTIIAFWWHVVIIIIDHYKHDLDSFDAIPPRLHLRDIFYCMYLICHACIFIFRIFEIWSCDNNSICVLCQQPEKWCLNMCLAIESFPTFLRYAQLLSAWNFQSLVS